MRVVGAGLSCIDIYERDGAIDRLYPTGNSVDFVIHLSRAGLRTSMVSVVGDDAHGELMAEVLRRERVDISHLHIEPGDTAVFRMKLQGNDRVHAEKQEGVMAHFALTEADIHFIRQHDMLHTNFSGKIIDQLPLFKSYGLQIVFDYSIHANKQAEPVLPYVDYVFFSYQQEDAYILSFMEWAQRLGPQAVIVTLGEQGSLAYDGQRFYRQGIQPAEAVNTVGAGDSFCAGFMYGIANGWGIQQCLENGASLASQVVARFEPY